MSQQENKGPQRRYELNLKLGADSWDYVLRALHQIEIDLSRLAPIRTELGHDYESVSGGPDYGTSIKIKFDADMTHEKYFEQLDQWLDNKNADNGNS